MESITNKDYDTIGYVEKAECGGWFAYVGDPYGNEEMTEAYFKTKRQAVAWIKKNNK
jgi:hypothetical protein